MATAMHLAGRALAFLGRGICSVLLLLVVAALQAPAVLWYVTAATPACDVTVTAAQLTGARVGLGALALASAALAVVLGARFLRLRWGWLVWWVVPVLAVAAPLVAVYLLPKLSPGTGGLLCH